MTIPCTVGVLTFNSAAVLDGALASARGFGEILVCDGGSTDATPEIAARHGARLIDQDARYKDSHDRLVDVAGARDQIVEAATYDWIFMLDSDELLTPELRDEITSITANESTPPGAYRVPRLYVLDGRVIECSMLYPRTQTRFLHRSVLVRYQGLVHEDPVIRDGIEIGQLTAHQLVPQAPLPELWRKWRGYLRLEEVKHAQLSWAEWRVQVGEPNVTTVKWLAYRFVATRRNCRGTRLPVRYELGYLAYYSLVLWYSGRRFLGLGRADVERAWE